MTRDPMDQLEQALRDAGVLEGNVLTAFVAARAAQEAAGTALDMKDAPRNGDWVIGIFPDGVSRQMRWAEDGQHAAHWMAFGRWTPIDPTGWFPMPLSPSPVPA